MRRADFTAMLDVRDRDAFLQETLRFTRALGFDLVTTFVALDRCGSETEFYWVDNAPTAYSESPEYICGAIDPVGQHCRLRNTPIVWDRATYVSVGRADRWEFQAAFGYRTGIAFALHLPGGRHFLVGVDRDQALPADEAEVWRMTANLQLFAVYAQESAQRVLLPAETPPVPSAPTLRELECLRWTMEGKTAWEIGRILGISEQTVARHLHHAAKRLDCVNKHHAVVKCLRLGLIS